MPYDSGMGSIRSMSDSSSMGPASAVSLSYPQPFPRLPTTCIPPDMTPRYDPKNTNCVSRVRNSLAFSPGWVTCGAVRRQSIVIQTRKPMPTVSRMCSDIIPRHAMAGTDEENQTDSVGSSR